MNLSQEMKQSWKNVKIMKLIIHKYDDSNGAKTMEKKSKLSQNLHLLICWSRKQNKNIFAILYDDDVQQQFPYRTHCTVTAAAFSQLRERELCDNNQLSQCAGAALPAPDR